MFLTKRLQTCKLVNIKWIVKILIITIITLSQILVMHNQTSNTNFHQIKLMQEELKLMDFSIDKMLKQTVKIMRDND